MATGYTYNLKDNPNYSLEQFIWHCAQSFVSFPSINGVLRIPEFDEYYRSKTKDYQEELSWYQSLSLDDVERKIFEDKKEMIEQYFQWIEEKVQLLFRYNRMLTMVNAWTPPSEGHIFLKKFMIAQLKQSISHDCDIEYDVKNLIKINKEKITPKQWLANRIKDTLELIKSAEESDRAEMIKVQMQRTYLTQLQNNTPFPRP